MKLISKMVIIYTTLFCLLSCAATSNSTIEVDQDELTFIVAADWRYFATERYHSSEYFQGVLEAIAEYGKGSFMVSPGDFDPVAPSVNIISEILGEHYPWYPVIGNHDFEKPVDIQTLRAINVGGNTLANIVNMGPPGSIETMYSFDYGETHFVVLNQYFDGTD